MREDHVELLLDPSLGHVEVQRMVVWVVSW